jgi:hypothetical protein
MEMQRCRLIAKVIVNIDHDVVTDVGVNSRNRPFAVDANCRAVKRTVRIRSYPTNVKIMLNDGGMACSQQRCQH